MTHTQEKTVDELLRKRDEEYDNYTKKIFDIHGHKLSRVLPFLINYDRDISWDSIDRYGTSSNLLCVYTTITYKEGDIIPTYDGPKRVMKEGYKGKVRFLIFINSLENKEVIEIVDEIKRLREYERGLSATESYKLFCDPDFEGTLDGTKFESLKEKIYDDNDPRDFDFSKLTKEQQEKLLESDSFFLNESGTVN